MLEELLCWTSMQTSLQRLRKVGKGRMEVRRLFGTTAETWRCQAVLWTTVRETSSSRMREDCQTGLVRARAVVFSDRFVALHVITCNIHLYSVPAHRYAACDCTHMFRAFFEVSPRH